MDQMIRYLKQNNFNFFLYEEHYWMKNITGPGKNFIRKEPRQKTS